MSLTTSVLTWTLLSGCWVWSDPDGDRLPTAEEKELGTNPEDEDSDDDGLDDLEEVDWTGTDPMLADTDGDGTPDGEEVRLGLDPKDAASRPYTLDWPMVPAQQKDLLDTGVAPPIVEVGRRMRRTYLYDIFGEVFDIYDAAGRPVLINIIDSIHEPEEASLWLDLNPDNDIPRKPALWVRDAAFAGDIFLIIVAGEGSRNPPDSAEPPSLDSDDLTAFCAFDHPEVGCFADFSWELSDHTQLSFAQSNWLLLDENMIVRAFAQDVGSMLDEEWTPDFEQKLAIMLDITPP